MEVGGMDKKEPRVEVPWIPATPAKPILTTPAPICMLEAQNQQPGHQHASEAVACFEFSAGVVPVTDESVPAATLANIAGGNGKTCVQGASDNISFSELLFLAEAASKNSGGMLPENNDGLKNPFIPSSNSQFNGDLQGTSYIPCCTNKTSQDTLPTPDNAIIAESRQIASMQINMEVKEPWGEEENVPAKELDNNGTPPNNEPSDLVTELAAASTPFKENQDPDNGSSHDIDLTKTPHPKRRRRKHRPKVIIEGKPKRTRKSATPKPFQSKENPTVKRKYVRRKGSNKTSPPPTEVTGELTKEIMSQSAKMTCRRSFNFEIGARDESSAWRENATAHLAKEIGVVQETKVGLVHDLNTSTKQPSNNYIVISDDSESPGTSLRRNRLRAKPKEKPTAKRRRARRKGLNKTSGPTTEVTGELSKEMMPEYAKTSCRRSLNFGIEAKDESSAGIENENVHLSKEIGVAVQETNIGLPNLKISVKQASNNYMSLFEDKQAPNTSPSKSNPPEAKAKENATGKKQYVRRKRSSKSTTTPTEMTAALTEPKMPDSTKMSWRSSAGRESLNEHISKGNNSLKQTLSSYMSLPEDTQALSTSPAKSNPPTANKNEKATGKRKYVRKKGMNKSSTPSEMTAELTEPVMPESTKMARRRSLNFDVDARDENFAGRQSLNVHNNKENGVVAEETHVGLAYSQSTSMKRLQIVGPKRKHSGTIEPADTSCMNEIGAHYNEFPSYQTKFRVQFPNIQKKRRSDKGKSSDTSITSSVTNTKEVELTCPQEVAQALPYASSSSSWSFGSEYITARVPTISEATESVIDDPQAFEDFIFKLRRVTKRPRLPPQICDCTSLTRIRNFGTEPNYSVNQLCISEMQQHQNFALGNYHLPLGKSSLDIACEVRWQIIQNVNALSEQFSQLDINKEARYLAFHEQNALVLYKQQNKKQSSLVNGDGTVIPFQGSFDPIKKQLPRPKVDIDKETDRVWKLLMLDINSHGIDGTDEDKAKWWEEERNVFRGRADSFIARMHLVQGDRRFSRWKGSVLDSVVGVFLTQNVSDHLSSSAFMSLAARFPRKSNSTCKTYRGEGTSLLAKDPQVHIVEPEENTEWDVKILNQSVYDQSSMTIDITEHSGEKEAANSSCRTTSSVISLTDESNCRLSESSQRNIGEHHSPVKSGLVSAMNEEGEEKSCYEGVRKEFNDIVSSQCSVISSQISGDFSNDQNPEKIGSCSDSNSEVEDLSSTAKYSSFYDNSTSFSKLLEMASSTKLHEVNSQRSKSAENLRHAYGQSVGMKHDNSTENLEKSNVTEGSLEASIISSHPIHKDAVRNETNEISSAPIKLKSKGQGKEKKDDINWDSLRIQAQAKAGKREKTKDTMDSLDWDAVRCADVNEIANAIKERGMNNRLAERIKNFLNRLVEEHGDIDLEWLRDVPPDQAKEYLLSVRGLGLKSVECVRLLTLHHLAFPVDTNVGRIAVRLGWVPLQPLPESLQLHLLELYPILESIQKYLWPRLCKLDQRTLYELHYQMITFGKVFCTKSKPNCNACPMRGECRHFASAFASARLALPEPEQKSIVSTSGNNVTDPDPSVSISQLHLPPPENTNQAEEIQETEVSRQLESKSETNICQPIIEEPTTPEPECSQLSQNDIEDAFYEDVCEIPTIKLNMEEFTLNLQNYMQANMELQEGEMSKALVALNPEAASIPMPKLKNVSRLRTEHCVYELPDTHPLLEGWDTREPDDPGKYLLAIWTPGETANSIQPPESKCSSQECGQLCNEKECFACNSFREANSQIVRGTLLIPCKTAMRGSFPLNGTYFQVNEVFADHDSSLDPISVPRNWLWNLNRRTVYFGTSIPTIFKGLSTQEIQQCFWRGYVCVRGFDRETRAPRPLMARLHFPASKMPKPQEKTRKRPTPANTQGSEPNPEHPELIPELISDGHNLKETGSELVKTNEKKRKRSTPAKAKGSKSNPEHPELISDGHNLQETGSKNAKPKRRPRKRQLQQTHKDWNQTQNTQC